MSRTQNPIALLMSCLLTPAFLGVHTDDPLSLEEYYPFGFGNADPVVTWHEGSERSNVYDLLSKEILRSSYYPEAAVATSYLQN